LLIHFGVVPSHLLIKVTQLKWYPIYTWPNMLKVLINNQSINLPAGSTVSDALSAFGPSEGPYAVALNDEFLPKSRYNQQPLTDGDTLDLVTPVGGG
jgi:sulfur carrier protein